MPTAEEYLHITFEHYAEFVEGKLVERPAPCWDHSRMQEFLAAELWPVERPLGWRVMIELTVQTAPDRFRVPDVCIIRERPDPESRGIITRPPYLCVEILSPEDPAIEILGKVREYLRFGVDWVWVVDPVSLSGQVHSRTGASNVDRIFSTDKFSIDLF